jgi:hypothetical protein
MKIKSLKSSLLLLLLAAVAAVAQDREQCSVTGRVVNDSNEPAANAYLLWDPGYGGGIDYITVFGRTDEEGKFKYQAACPIGQLRLYVTSTLSTDNYLPVTPPFPYGKLSKQFKGLPVVKNEKGDLNLGDVAVQVYYSTAVIRFLDESGAPLLPEKNAWNNVTLRIRDKNRKLFSEQRLSPDSIEKAVRPQNSAIVMDLPVGEWLVELSLNQGKPDWLKPDKLVVLQRSNSPTEVSLRMSNNKSGK